MGDRAGLSFLLWEIGRDSLFFLWEIGLDSLVCYGRKGGIVLFVMGDRAIVSFSREDGAG